MVSADDQIGRWLQHRIETLDAAVTTALDDMAGFDHRIATSDLSGFDVLVAALDFAPAATTPAKGWIDHALDIPGLPPLLVVADNGDELCAVAAIRRGVAGYLPRRQLTPALLTEGIDDACTTHPQLPAAPAEPVAYEAMPAPLRVPRELIPRYMLLDTLGESARATVYLAHSEALGRHVALKVSRVSTEDEEPHFAREFAAIGGLRHPGVVDIYDYGVHEGREFIAMEYFPCGDLKARLQNPVSEQEALQYLARIATALAAVHAQGILHRDLKPPNIMLREDGEVVLIDFGLAKNLDHGTRSTRAGVLRGSPYYMSPEQAQGIELDPRSDLYSLGVIFHELLTGTKPYLGATAVEVLQQHVSGAVPQLPPELAHHQPLLEGLMAKDREDRFASTEALTGNLPQAAA